MNRDRGRVDWGEVAIIAAVYGFVLMMFLAVVLG